MRFLFGRIIWGSILGRGRGYENIKMNKLKSWAVNLLKGEYTLSEILGRLLIVVAIFNLPSPLIFIPYLTQAITILILAVFLKKYKASTLNKSQIVVGICVAIMIIQIPLIWMFYVTQFITLILVAVLYGIFTKYK